MSTKRKLPCDSLDLQPRSSSALIVNARTSVLRARSSAMCCVIAERRNRRGDAEHADVVRHLQLRQRLHVSSPDRWRSRCACRPCRTPSRTCARRTRWASASPAEWRSGTRVGHVVVIRLVDQDDRVGRNAARTRCTKSAMALLPCTVAVGLFGLFRKTRPAPFAAGAMPSRSRRSAAVDLDLDTG